MMESKKKITDELRRFTKVDDKEAVKVGDLEKHKVVFAF